MAGPQVTAVFDVGKSNKKLILFDENFHALEIVEDRLPEISDEEGFPCEDVKALTTWIREHFDKLIHRKDVGVTSLNFSGYGASLVNLDKEGNVLGHLENYLKPFPEQLTEKFQNQYGPIDRLAAASASPWLGNLNSGLQLFRIKYLQSVLFQRIAVSLHLPQYLSWIITGETWNDLTSMGCHTMMWDFNRRDLCQWVRKEKFESLLPSFFQQNQFYSFLGPAGNIKIGHGIHDSSAALIPYLSTLQDPFVLISTGTWSISLNPFNHVPLTAAELEQDCLCYLTPDGRQVKASRLLLGPEFEKRIAALAKKYQCAPESLLKIAFNPRWQNELIRETIEFEVHQLNFEFANKQKKATSLILDEGSIHRIYVDGGFSKNELFMQMLAMQFKGYEVYAADLPQASAMGAAIQVSMPSSLAPSNLKNFTFKRYGTI